MGIQATIEIRELLAAGVTCKVLPYETYDWDDINECERPITVYDLHAEFPDGATFVFNMGDARDSTVWCDFNRWGRNRPVLEPLLERHHIPWTEG